MFLEQIANETKLRIQFVHRVAYSANYLYRTYTIPKKTGGVRIIEHPAKRLKVLQRWIVANYVAKMPVHPAATAYRKGLSIKDNALQHAQNSYLLRIDLKDFFSSLHSKDINCLFRRHNHLFDPKLTDEELRTIEGIVCRWNKLPIGAPSSPALSNALMFEFDVKWAKKALDLCTTYTRYADDLVFSTNDPNILVALYQEFLQARYHPGGLDLLINDKKTVFSSKKHRRMVTGMTLTSVGTTSIGRARKREIKTLIFRELQNDAKSVDFDRLRGLLAFTNAVDQEFLVALEKKFGKNCILQLMGKDF